jgi:hypothetical protein
MALFEDTKTAQGYEMQLVINAIAPFLFTEISNIGLVIHGQELSS